MATRYNVTVTKKGRVERSYDCKSCGTRALAHVTVEASGSTTMSRSSGYVYDASRGAHEEFARRSVDVLGLARCPSCQVRNAMGSMKLGIAVASIVTLGSAILVWKLRATFLMLGPLVILLWAGSRLHRWWYLWRAAPLVTFEKIRANPAAQLPRAKLLP